MVYSVYFLPRIEAIKTSQQERRHDIAALIFWHSLGLQIYLKICVKNLLELVLP